MLNPAELSINDEARNDAHITNTGVPLCLAHTHGCHIRNEMGKQ